MSFSDVDVKESHACNGVQTDFIINFDFTNNTEIKVYVRDESEDLPTETLKVLTTDYTLIGGPPVTTVRFNSAPADGLIVTLIRQNPITQSASYAVAGPFPNSTTEEALDKLTRLVQEVDEKVARAHKLQKTSTEVGLDLPDVGVANGLRVLILNEAETAFEWGPTASNIEEAEGFANAAEASAEEAAASAVEAAASAASAATFAGAIQQKAFVGDGSDVTFDLDFAPTHENGTFVFIDGVYQPKTTYSVAGVTITFSEAPLDQSNIEVMVYETFDAALVQAIADDAEASRLAAETAETNAETAETNAETAETNAEIAQAAAEAAQAAAEAAAAAASVVGPVSSTDTAIVRWNGTTGNTLKDSPVTIADAGKMVITPAAGANTNLQLLEFNHAANQNPTINFKASDTFLGLQFASAGTVVARIFNNGYVQGVTGLAVLNGMVITATSITLTGAGKINLNGVAANAAIDLINQSSSTTYTSAVQATSGAAAVPILRVKGAAAQSANAFEAVTSADALLGGFDKGGIPFTTEQGSTPGNPAAGMRKLYPKTDGNWYHLTSAGVESPLGGGAYGITGTRASPSAIVAGTGIAFTGASPRQLWFIEGSGGAVDVSANPQIAAGSAVGQELVLIGRSDTNTVTLEDGTGLDLNGTMELGASSILNLVWDGTNWCEISRR